MVHKICTAARQTAAWEHFTCKDEADLKDTLAMADVLHANGHLFQDVDLMEEDDQPADKQREVYTGERKKEIEKRLRLLKSSCMRPPDGLQTCPNVS